MRSMSPAVSRGCTGTARTSLAARLARGVGSTRTVPAGRHARPARRRQSDARTTPADQRACFPRYCAPGSPGQSASRDWLTAESMTRAHSRNAATLVAGAAISSSAGSAHGTRPRSRAASATRYRACCKAERPAADMSAAGRAARCRTRRPPGGRIPAAGRCAGRCRAATPGPPPCAPGRQSG